MPSIAATNSSPSEEINGMTPQKRRLRSDTMALQDPKKLKSLRPCTDSTPNCTTNRKEIPSKKDLDKSQKSPVKSFLENPTWNPRDMEQLSIIKDALHVSTAPSTVVCRDEEHRKLLDFCKACIEQDKAGSLYICGCPGTGKSLSMEKVKQQVVQWANEEDMQVPEVLGITCTSLTSTSEIFSKILDKYQLKKKINSSTSPLQSLQNLFSQKPQSPGSKMLLLIADELDYLITKDRAVLHDLFMLTTLPFSRCILIGIANAIDLTDRFLPRLKALNCKPWIVTFRAYSKDQILRILKERLAVLPCIVFQPQALELCARKVAAVSGDMRKALSICRSAIEMLEAELKESSSNMKSSTEDGGCLDQQTALAPESRAHDFVKFDHMAAALLRTYKSPVVEIIQSLPQHQQMILCSAVKFFRGGKKDTTVAELNVSYTNICKSVSIPPVGTSDFSNMCGVLNDQGIIKLGNGREDKQRRVTLKIDEADISFALQGVRFFRNCLQ